jgi:hypothetical protein
MEKRADKRKSQGPRRLSVVDLDKVEHKFTVVLNREANQLLDRSWKNPLPDEAAKTLVNYMKLLKELKVQKEKELENLSDEDLQNLSTKENAHV